MARIWTDAQKQAITSRDGTILVSAAAGSGKTAVLVERVIERITDKNNPVDIEKLLIVTFTKAAAAEMKERISTRLSEMISAEPRNQYLKRQKMYLPNAQISTMDSFCSRLVKENFDKLDIAPDYTMLSDIEHDMLKNEVVSEVLEEAYNLPQEEIDTFLRLFTNGRNDRNLTDAVLTLYDFALSSANPIKWVEDCFKPYFEDTAVENTEWGKYCLNYLREILQFTYEKATQIAEDTPENTKLELFIENEVAEIKDSINRIFALMEKENSWNEIKTSVDTLSLNRFPRLSAEEGASPETYEIKNRRDGLKKLFASAQEVMNCTAEEYAEDIKYIQPIVSVFKKCVLRFIELLAQRKNENNTYYFSDILHFTLRLLVTFNEDGTYEKTQLANELSDNFAEILIDEFQDTNEAQDTLFTAISKDNGNKFMVGDVKQSIYRFRQAMPEIFVGYKDSFDEYRDNNYPATICLDRNFRSKKGIVEGINFFFKHLMSKDLGGVDYAGNGESLVFGGNYDDVDSADVAVHLIDTDKARGSDLESEARHIGDVIKQMMDDGVTVGKKGAERPLKYSDICILLRAVKNKASVIAEELIKMGIPAHFQKQGGFFDSTEIVTMFSMLKIIDNPVQDVPLVSVMLSPLCPFTEDDLARYRIDSRKGNIYSILNNQYDKDEKAKSFLDLLSLLRTLSVTMDVGSLIRRILEITSYDSIVGAMDRGEKRVLNLQLLINYAENYEASGGSGLSGFIRYLDKIRKNDKDLEGANEISENDDVVRIMSIHKSKGLEFPVVFLANASSGFNVTDYNKVRLHRDLGVGFTRYFESVNKEFPTLPFNAIKLANKHEEASELIRVLYVAMTRAEEKFYILGSMYNPQKKVDDLYYTYYSDFNHKSVPFLLTSSFMQWTLMCMLNHPEFTMGDEYRNRYVIPHPVSPEIEFKMVSKPDEELTATEEKTAYTADKDIYNALIEKLSYAYPYADLSSVPIKYAASSMDNEATLKYLTTENPAFSGAGDLTPAQRGTLTHRFMETCDFAKAKENLENEIVRLRNDGIFTTQEVDALNVKHIKEFFKSGLYNRIVNAEKYAREQEFAMSVPVSQVNDTLPDYMSDEQVIVQGIIDGLVINGNKGEIVDFKTDRVETEEELVERYKEQMTIYKKAAEECFSLQNVTVTLYSFHLSKEISVKL